MARDTRSKLREISDDATLPEAMRVQAVQCLGKYYGEPWPAGIGLTPTDPLDRLKQAVDEVNTAWAQISKPYSLWIDWQHRPPRVVITQGIHIERDIVYP